MILGEHLQIAIGGTPLAASKSCKVSKSQSFIETASPTSGRWESFVPQKLGWRISSDCLLATMDAYKTLDSAWKAGTALDIRFHDTEYNENEIGTAYIENLDIVATKGNLAKMSVSLRGSGELSEYGTPIEVFRTTIFDSKYYYGQGGYYNIVDYSTVAKVIGCNFYLPDDTYVRFINNGNTLILSQDSNLIGKAQSGLQITPNDYRYTVGSDKVIKLNGGTWYMIETNRNYTQGANVIDMVN